MAIQSITTGPRQTNFEILRMIAMFFVLMVHCTFDIPFPTAETIDSDFVPSATRALIQTTALYGVNIFVMISGWFTIKFTLRGLGNFLFQIYYFGAIILLFLSLNGVEQFTLGRLYLIVMLHKSGWFTASYLILFLLAPVLNKYSEYAEKKDFMRFLIPYFIMLIIFGYLHAWNDEIGRGYSALSMVGMYLLARYARKYVNIRHGGRLFLACTVLNSILTLCVERFNIPMIVNSYDNPFVFLGALGLIFYFNKLEVKYSRVINYMARSTFAVYLLHIYPNVMDWFTGYCKVIYDSSDGILCLLKMALFLLTVYVLAIVLDAPRRLIWNGIIKFSMGLKSRITQ